jgi:hypothetical protein
MKKILFLIMLFVGMVVTVSAQTKTGSIPVGNTYIDMDFSATADTLGSGRTVYTIQVNSPQRTAATQDLFIKLDSISGSKATVQLQGAKFTTSAYASIGSAVTWAGSSADTSIVVSNTTANRYQYYRVVVTRTAGTLKISDLLFKLYL